MTPMDKNGAEPVAARFARFPTTAGPQWLAPLRQAGLDAFARLGFPSLRDEDWRFTNVAPVAGLDFKPAAAAIVNGAESQAVEESVFAPLAGPRLVFVNGVFCAALSTIPTLPEGVRVQSLATALAADSGFIRQHLGKYAQAAKQPFTALNQACFTDGAFVSVPANVELAEPVLLFYLSTAQKAGETIMPRNLIVAGANSKLAVMETYLGMTDAGYFTNAVTEIVAGDHASVEHVKLQDEALGAYHIAAIAGEFGRASRVNVHSFALGARLSRNDIRVRLAGEGLECILNGLYLTRDEQLADHYMIVEHAQPHCASHEYFNGILDDNSKGVFHGRIYVHPAAQKTDAKQTNKNLLLSDNATADTKPQLEIYADDVKCTHGATVGQLNPESIFYLRTRGMSLETARRMLIHAFAGEIIERIQCEPARGIIDRLVWDRLEARMKKAE